MSTSHDYVACRSLLLLLGNPLVLLLVLLVEVRIVEGVSERAHS